MGSCRHRDRYSRSNIGGHIFLIQLWKKLVAVKQRYRSDVDGSDSTMLSCKRRRFICWHVRRPLSFAQQRRKLDAHNKRHLRHAVCNDACTRCKRCWPGNFYCIDHGLVTSTSSGILVNSGHLLENLVYNALRRLTPDVYYLKTKSGGEVDFVAKREDSTRLLVQTCESLVDPKTRKREVTAQTEEMIELGLNSATIVTRNEDEVIEVKGGNIEVIPAWRFLLNLSE